MNDKIKKEVLQKIKKGEVEIRPKIFFEIIKIILTTLMVISIILSVFLFNIAFYLPKRAGAFKTFHFGRLFLILSSMPWLLIVFGAIFIGTFIYIYRKYEGGYKKHLSAIIIIISLLVLTTGGIIAASNINERFENRSKIKRFYQWGEKRFGPPKEHFPMKNNHFPPNHKLYKKF